MQALKQVPREGLSQRLQLCWLLLLLLLLLLLSKPLSSLYGFWHTCSPLRTQLEVVPC
jgi:hypothetical protein